MEIKRYFENIKTPVKIIQYPLFIFIVCLFTVSLAYAQGDNGLTVGLSRDFGYGGFGNDIQGIFSIKIVEGPEDLTSVTFMIDDQLIAEGTEAPFKVQFSTDSYPLGLHRLYATGITSDGQELRSNEINVEFVAAEEGWKAAGKIAIPIFGLIFGVMLFSFIIPVVFSRQKKAYPMGAPRKYGISGGAICPKCKRPFAIHFFAPNLLASKLDLCPYCGKWSVLRPASRDQLSAAEQAELRMANGQIEMPEESEEAKLRKDLDNSRYHDL